MKEKAKHNRKKNKPQKVLMKQISKKTNKEKKTHSNPV